MGKQNGKDTLETNLAFSHKVEHIIIIHPSNPHPRPLSKQNEIC